MTARKSARFRVGLCFNPYPTHYRQAFAFSAVLYPPGHQCSLRLTCRFRQPFGFTLFRMNLRAGRTLPLRRRWFVHDGPVFKAHSSPLTFWFKPISTFGLLKLTTFTEVHLCWSYPLIPSSSPPSCWQISLCLTAQRTDPRWLHCPQSFTPNCYRLRMSG
jgi:hypothetical protein